MAKPDHTQPGPSLLRRYRTLILTACALILIALWAAFRPEKLFTTVKVNESAPAGLADAQPLFTGSLHAVGTAPEIHGRVNVLQTGGGLQLQLQNLQSKTPAPLTVTIAADDPGESGVAANAISIGQLPGGSSPRLPLPAGTDPAVSKYVIFSDAPHHPVARAALEKF